MSYGDVLVRFVFVSALFVFVFGPVESTQAQTDDESLKLPLQGEVVLPAGKTFQNYRFALSFEVPGRARIRVQPRGLAPLAEIRPLPVEQTEDNQSYYILTTSFRIRREGQLAELARKVYGPCPLGDAPEKLAAKNGRHTATCADRVGLNRLERKILLIRDNDLLHLFYITYRLENRETALKILEGVAPNKAFYIEEPTIK